MDAPFRSERMLRLETAMGRFRMLDSLRIIPGMENYGTNLFRRVISTAMAFSPLNTDQLLRIRDEVISWDTTEVAQFSYTHEHRQGALKTYLLGLQNGPMGTAVNFSRNRTLTLYSQTNWQITVLRCTVVL